MGTEVKESQERSKEINDSKKQLPFHLLELQGLPRVQSLSSPAKGERSDSSEEKKNEGKGTA